jgi:hypothetical protein
MQGEDITGGDFLRAARAFITIIEQVADEIAHRKGSVETIVTVSAGSNRLHVTALQKSEEVPGIDLIEKGVLAGLAQIERIKSRPLNFNAKALSGVRSLAAVLRSKDYPVNHLLVKANGETLEITGNSEVAANEILRADYHDYGTVEGKLQMITERKRTRIYVFDALTDKKVGCRIDPEIRQQALSAFGRRVEVRGLIRYRHDGEPISIIADGLELLDKDHELPTANDVLGILGAMR